VLQGSGIERRPSCSTPQRTRASGCPPVGITIGIVDVVIPPRSRNLLAAADEKSASIEQNFDFGFLTEEERYKQVVQLWNDTTDEVKSAVFENFSRTTRSTAVDHVAVRCPW
jgi:DNA-directed RNA polymerase beta' subunit